MADNPAEIVLFWRKNWQDNVHYTNKGWCVWNYVQLEEQLRKTEEEQEKGMCHDEGSSVPKLHLILEECLPCAHSNQT